MDERKASGLTVLVVEDSDDIRFLARLELESRGYKVFEAVNGEEAVAAARLRSPDIILMDLSLPVLDGLAASRLIRAEPKLKDTLIVAVTAHIEMQYRAEALAAGCNAYVTKPVDFNWLDGLLENLLP